MSWETIYLVCFVVGFSLSLLAFLMGAFHFPFSHWPHLPHAAGHHAGIPHAHGTDASSAVSPYNFSTFMAFLAWFGGMGYLLASRSRLGYVLVLAIALATGLAGAAVVFAFLTKVLLPHERSLDAADFEMVGVLGTVSVPIRPEGTGEIIYSQAGTRRCSGARSEDGSPILRGSEVVVTRYEKGIAYVRRWDEFASGVPAGSPAVGSARPSTVEAAAKDVLDRT